MIMRPTLIWLQACDQQAHAVQVLKTKALLPDMVLLVNPGNGPIAVNSSVVPIMSFRGASAGILRAYGQACYHSIE